jgi:hypothetical protein
MGTDESYREKIPEEVMKEVNQIHSSRNFESEAVKLLAEHAEGPYYNNLVNELNVMNLINAIMDEGHLEKRLRSAEVPDNVFEGLMVAARQGRKVVRAHLMKRRGQSYTDRLIDYAEIILQLENLGKRRGINGSR